jgi:putative Mn2+ efflux pump MntP
MTHGITSILLGSVLLSIVHALIPMHWLPIITIAKAEKWTDIQSVIATSIIAFFHMFSTVLVGVCVAFLGYRLSLIYEVYAKIFASLILILIGLYYLCNELMHKLGHKWTFLHFHHHHHEHVPTSPKNFKSLVLSMSTVGFLTPCLELETYYIGVGPYGWKAIGLVSLIYMLITIFLIVLLVYLGLKGVNSLKFAFFEKYEYQIIGAIMLLIGVSIYLLD